MQLIVSADRDKVAEHLRTQYLTDVNSLVERLEEKIALQETAGESTDIQTEIAKREAINVKHVAAVKAKHIALQKALERLNKSNVKLTALTTQHAEYLTAVRTAKADQRQIEQEIQKKTEGKGLDPGLEVFEANARAIAASAAFIDESEPVVIQDKKFEWTTCPIFILDSDGTVLPVEFGKFKISLSIGSGGGLLATMMPQTPNSISGYCHPHIHTNGRPCLGNAGNMLLRALNSGRIGLAITTVHEYLTNYNIRSPYIILSEWTPCRWHDPACACGLILQRNCGCDACTECGRISALTPTSDYGCGTCSGCCADSHYQNEAAGEHRAGVNGSICMPQIPNGAIHRTRLTDWNPIVTTPSDGEPATT